MRNFLTTTIVILAVFAVMMANNYSRGAPDKEYKRLYSSETAQIVSSKEYEAINQKINETLISEGYEVQDFFIRARNFNGAKISIVVLLNPNELKIFELISEYNDSMYSLLVTGAPTFWLENETENFINSCDFIIQEDKIVMISKDEL